MFDNKMKNTKLFSYTSTRPKNENDCLNKWLKFVANVKKDQERWERAKPDGQKEASLRKTFV